MDARGTRSSSRGLGQSGIRQASTRGERTLRAATALLLVHGLGWAVAAERTSSAQGRPARSTRSALTAAPLGQPIPLPKEPNSLVYGHAATVYLQVLAAGQLDSDRAGDLVIGELVTGQHSDEPMESALLLGRFDWPARSGTEGLGVRKIAEPAHTTDDNFSYVGAIDLNGDRRDDLVTALARRSGPRVTAVTLQVNFSPPSWPVRPDLRQGDVVLAVPSKTVPRAILAADVNCDRLNDLIVTADDHVGILFGRQPWPAALSLEPPDVRIDPPSSVVRAADVTGDGCADLWLSLDGGSADAALVSGRPEWPAVAEAEALAEVLVGEGHYQLDGAIVPDVTGDGVADALRIDHVAGAVEVYAGGPDLLGRLLATASDWSVTGISDTWRVEWLDLTGDGVAELLFDRHALVAGGMPRRGTIDLARGEYEADWPTLGDSQLWSLDVDGRNGADVLLGDASAAVAGRKGAGTIRIFLSPLFTPPPPTSPLPTPSLTPSPPTPGLSPTPATPSPETSPSPSGTRPPPSVTPTPGERTPTTAVSGGRIWLPIAWTPVRET